MDYMVQSSNTTVLQAATTCYFLYLENYLFNSMQFDARSSADSVLLETSVPKNAVDNKEYNCAHIQSTQEVGLNKRVVLRGLVNKLLH